MIRPTHPPARPPHPRRVKHLIRVTRHLIETGYILAEPGSRREQDVLTGVRSLRDYLWLKHQRRERLTHTDLGPVAERFSTTVFKTQYDDVGLERAGHPRSNPLKPPYALLRAPLGTETLAARLTEAAAGDGLLRGVVEVSEERYAERLTQPAAYLLRLAEAVVGQPVMTAAQAAQFDLSDLGAEIVGVGLGGLHVEVTLDAPALLKIMNEQRGMPGFGYFVTQEPLTARELCDMLGAVDAEGQTIDGVVSVAAEIVREAEETGDERALIALLGSRLAGRWGLAVTRFEQVGHNGSEVDIRVWGVLTTPLAELRNVAAVEPTPSHSA